MIDLGLARIGRLLQHAPPPAWKAVQVSGTNGKGSVCAYLSAMLHARGVASARFTSPHLVDRWDCVVVGERVVAESVFVAAEQAVQQRDRAQQIQATEFELLTATAFDVFGSLPSGAIVVVECGLGGALDATTAMRADRAVTVITRIGLDHQGLLGSSVAAIAKHKAGIMRPGVPCVVDAANGADPAIRSVLEARAREVGATLVFPDAENVFGGNDKHHNFPLEPHQLSNLALAYTAFRLAVGDATDVSDAVAPVSPGETPFLASVLDRVRWPGRLQTINVGPLLDTTMSVPALLDGAHNPQSADVLAAYVDKHLRRERNKKTKTETVTWILAASRGKDVDAILRPLVRPGDRVAAVTFGAVDGMPWVEPAEPQTILDRATALGVDVGPAMQFNGSPGGGHRPDGLMEALQWATSANTGIMGPLVLAGSLYLVSDTLRLLKHAGGETGLP